MIHNWMRDQANAGAPNLSLIHKGLWYQRQSENGQGPNFRELFSKRSAYFPNPNLCHPEQEPSSIEPPSQPQGELASRRRVANIHSRMGSIKVLHGNLRKSNRARNQGQICLCKNILIISVSCDFFAGESCPNLPNKNTDFLGEYQNKRISDLPIFLLLAER